MQLWRILTGCIPCMRPGWGGSLCSGTGCRPGPSLSALCWGCSSSPHACSAQQWQAATMPSAREPHQLPWRLAMASACVNEVKASLISRTCGCGMACPHEGSDSSFSSTDGNALEIATPRRILTLKRVEAAGADTRALHSHDSASSKTGIDAICSSSLQARHCH